MHLAKISKGGLRKEDEDEEVEEEASEDVEGIYPHYFSISTILVVYPNPIVLNLLNFYRPIGAAILLWIVRSVIAPRKDDDDPIVASV